MIRLAYSHPTPSPSHTAVGVQLNDWPGGTTEAAEAASKSAIIIQRC